MAATLVVKAGITDKKEYRLEPGRAYFIGRSREADMIVKDQQASRRHCAIEGSADGTWTLADQESSNGTYVNRQRTASRALKDGDVVQIGKTRFEFHTDTPAAAPADKEKSDGSTIVLGPGQHTPDSPKAAAQPKPEPSPHPAPKPEPTSEPKPRPAPAPPPQPESSPRPTPKPAATPAARDADLDDLFAFLDKVEAGEQPVAEKPPAKDNDRSVRHEPPPMTPPPAEAPKDKDNGGALFSLLDAAKEDGADPANPQSSKAAPPPDEKQEKKGGLLSFLRKKKQS